MRLIIAAHNKAVLESQGQQNINNDNNVNVSPIEDRSDQITMATWEETNSTPFTDNGIQTIHNSEW